MEFTTLTQLYRDAVSNRPRSDMFRYKRDGRWVSVSTEDFDRAVGECAAALLVHGVEAGDRVALLSENRLEWALVDIATQRIGAVLVPIYPTLLRPQIEYILGDCEPVAVFCSTAQQVAKLDGIETAVPSIRLVVSFEPADRANGLTLERLRDLGRRNVESRKDEVDRRSDAVGRDDLATIIYTSGTTGQPKGVMLTHGNIAGNVTAGLQVLDVTPADVCLSFLPLSHILERMAGHYLMIGSGVSINYAESIETVAADMGEVRPTLMVSVPRLYEKIYARVIENANAGGALKRRIFEWARRIGGEYTDAHVEGRPVPATVEFQRRIGDALVFKKLRARTGGRLRFFVSGGAPLAKEIAEFFYSAGLPILEGYGLTETSPVISVNTFEKFRPGSVGPPVPGVEVKIADDGEILTRSPYVMKGYWKHDEATAETIIDGWLHTGDIGHIDENGFVFITDRKKDIIVTAGGKNVAPQPIENELKLDKHVAEAVVIGDRHRYLVALLVPNFEALEATAAEHGLDASDRSALVNHAEVQRIYADVVHAVNQRLASFEQLKTFRALDHEFTQDDGHLTPSMKVKRKVVSERYADVIESMYEEGS
ncbi:MAG TPA: long-chain fatty acid--CoA ligase [Candidatus Krumholzibacteria bacterium]|nr:long-chain fatty acid--CoA ligase [Candidatus Krumholzibacteria bacterium]